MTQPPKIKALLLALAFACTAFAVSGPAESPAKSVHVTVNWNQVTRASETTATLQVVVNPLLRRASPIHDHVFKNLKNLDCNFVRYVPWFPYPKLVVAELVPPTEGRTSWHFSLIDPMMADFMRATAGHPVVINFSTIPEWMFKTPEPVSYPSNANQVDWNYEQGRELRDPTLKEVAGYYARLVSWYTAGGFKDEDGREHASGHYYRIAYWEVLNEPELEHHLTPQSYTELYDAIAGSIHRVDPKIKFVALALAAPSREPEFFEYFLNPKNHKAGVPLDMISYHFYASPPCAFQLYDASNWPS